MAATQGQGGSYRVKPGESLWGIARAHGVSLQSLEAANPQITNPSLIRPGVAQTEGAQAAPARRGPQWTEFSARRLGRRLRVHLPS